MFFPPFRLDPENECVWKGSEQRRLKHKSFEVLNYLLKHAGRLVSKEELFDAVWPETHVGDAVLKVCIGEIRKVLDDSTAEPRFIETAHRRGYRFIAKVTQSAVLEAPRQKSVVERENAFFKLHSALADAKQGRRQLVFVTGEPGIGKTTLVESFTQQISSDSTCSITYGQCLDQQGAGEPYFPVLDALSRLCKQPGKQWMIDKLRQHAPTCLAQLSSLITEADRESLKREVVGAAKERMMREIAEAIEAATVESVIVFILEDLHWADHSTVDLISHLARRKEWSRLVLVATYRPADLIVSAHPLRSVTRELQVRGASSEIELDFLSEGAIRQYLTHRYPGLDASTLALVIRQRTDGNPLFMVNMLEYMSSTGELAAVEGTWGMTIPAERAAMAIPASLQQLIEKQLELLDERTRGLLEAASLRGLECSTREIAYVTDIAPEEVESCFDQLARKRQFVEKSGVREWPDGVFFETYRFVHALYREVLYNSISPSRSILIHKKLAGFLESNYLGMAAEIAPELAIHFKGGRDYLHAVYYLQEAAATAAKRFANVEAIEHLEEALTLLTRVPHAERVEPEAAVLDQLGLVYQSSGDSKSATKTFETCLSAARAISRYDLETNALLRLSGVLFWTDHRRSLEAADLAVQVSAKGPDRWWYRQARGNYAARKIRLQGWDSRLFDDCTQAVVSAREAGDSELLGLHLMSYSFFLSYQTEYERACQAADEGTELAIESGNAYQYISCQYFKAWALLHSGHWGDALLLVNQGITLSSKNGHRTGIAFFRLMKAWLLAQAFQYGEASELVEHAMSSAREGFPKFLGLILSGVCFTGLSQFRRAVECFNEVLEQAERGPYYLDWIFHLPLYLGLADLRLAQGTPQEARESAHRLLEMAASSNERTYIALAHQLLAEAAYAEGDWQTASDRINKAFSVIQRRELPLAAWRVNATAAKLAAHRGEHVLHDRYSTSSASILSSLAGSIAEHEPLRESILRHVSVRNASAGF